MRQSYLLLVCLAFSLNLGALSQSSPYQPGQRGPYTRVQLPQQSSEDSLRLRSTVEDLQESVVLLQEQNRKLQQDLSQIRQDVVDQGLKMVTAQSLEEWSRKFTEELEKLDARRIEDNQKLLDQLKLMAKQLADLPAPDPGLVVDGQPAGPEPGEESAEPEIGDYYEVTIQKGYTLASIAKTYQEQGLSVSVKDILGANPGINPRTLRIGQVIRIPAE